MATRRLLYVLLVLGLFLGLTGSGYAQSDDQTERFEPVDGPFVEGPPEHVEPIDAPIVEEGAWFPRLVAEAELIIIGSVSAVDSAYATNEWGDQLIVSDVGVTLEETLKGDAGDARKVVFRGITGGTVDGTTMRSSDTPLFIEGERVVLLLSARADGGYTIVGGDVGKLAIDAAGNVPQLGRTLEQFRGDLQGILSGQPPAAPAEQLSPDQDQDTGAEPPSTLGTDGADYVLNPYKWPGSSPMITFRLNNPGFNDANAGSPAKQNMEIRFAMDTWTVTGGARFGFGYGGTSTISATGPDGQHVVIVRNAISPDHPTALATAHSWITNNQLSNCDIVFWDGQQFPFSAIGASDAFDIRSVAIHEFGHCLGLAHSTVGGSIMYEYASYTPQHTLHADDLAGVRALYGVTGASTLWTSGYGYNGGWRVDQHPRLMGDVNGDGRDDVVGFYGDGVSVALSTGGRFAAPSWWTTGFSDGSGWQMANHPRMLADVNRDGKDDIVGFGNGGVMVAVAKRDGLGFSYPSIWVAGFGYTAGGWRVENHPRMMADVNGDGRADVVGFANDGVYVSTSTGSAFTAPSRWSTGYGYTAGWRVNMHPRMMADVNGDGRDDVVGFASDGVYVSTSTGTGFSAPTRRVVQFGYTAGGWRVENHPRVMADIDGDGRDDIVGFAIAGVYVATSTGTGFNAPVYWSNQFGYGASAGNWRVAHHPRYLTDVNGDGRADVVGFSNDGVLVALSTGASFDATPVPWVNAYGYVAGGWRTENHPRMMADVNGDGRADVVGIGGAGVFVSRSAFPNVFE